MTFVWLCVLVVYGLVAGWENIDPLFWWLLLPMVIQDSFDARNKRRR